MKAVSKYFVLTVVLVIPVVIYLFLEGFGVNKYSIPRYHEDGSATESKCIGLQFPHSVAFERLSASDIKPGGITLVFPVLDSCATCPVTVNQIKRVLQRHEGLRVISFYSEPVTTLGGSMNNRPDNWLIKKVDFPALIDFMRCELLIDLPEQTSIEQMREEGRLILLDNDNVIRGYYKNRDREDIDRLITEISILKDE